MNKLTSTKTQIPFDYYSLPYCHPKKVTEESENLGEVLSGDRIEKNTLYEVGPSLPCLPPVAGPRPRCGGIRGQGWCDCLSAARMFTNLDSIHPHPNAQLNFKVPAQCQTVCRVVLGEKEKKQFIKAIDQDYRVHWCVEGRGVAGRGGAGRG